MPIIPIKSSCNIGLYQTIKEILGKPINIAQLPVIGESKIFKPSAGRYGHVIIKLDVETKENINSCSANYCGYPWDVPENYRVNDEKSTSVLPISKNFEKDILEEITIFANLFRFLSADKTPLVFSVIGGSYRVSERPYFYKVTGEALVQIFRQLHEV